MLTVLWRGWSHGKERFDLSASCVEARRSSRVRYRHRPSCGRVLRGASNGVGILNCAVAAAGHWLTGILRCDPARQRRAQGKGVGVGHAQVPRAQTGADPAIPHRRVARTHRGKEPRRPCVAGVRRGDRSVHRSSAQVPRTPTTSAGQGGLCGARPSPTTYAEGAGLQTR